MTVRAYVLITTAARETKNVVTQLQSASAVQSVEAVSGPYDIIATIEAEDVNKLGQLITQEVHSVYGIERTLSCVVLQL